jgi:hypothetical protein
MPKRIKPILTTDDQCKVWKEIAIVLAAEKLGQSGDFNGPYKITQEAAEDYITRRFGKYFE